ncbi:MAG: hypothetical protein RLZZ347_832 [Candidatus Parcubacteria bacterium]|jgi:hypothetical protein
MKSTSTTNRTLRRIAGHLKANPTVVRFTTLVRIKGLNWSKLTDEDALRKALMPVADLINLPARFRKCLVRLKEIITIAGQCIENALAIKENNFAVETIVAFKKAAKLGWFKIVGFLDDGRILIQSVSNGKSIKTVAPRELELAIA